MYPFAFSSRLEPRRVPGVQAAVITMAGILGGCVGTGAGATAVAPPLSPVASASSFTVVSTLLGLTDLPHRIERRFHLPVHVITAKQP